MNETATHETVVVGETDLLYGVAQIACYLGLVEGRTRYMCERGIIPTFRQGRIICSRKTAIEASLPDMGPASVPAE